MGFDSSFLFVFKQEDTTSIFMGSVGKWDALKLMDLFFSFSIIHNELKFNTDSLDLVAIAPISIFNSTFKGSHLLHFIICSYSHFNHYILHYVRSICIYITCTYIKSKGNNVNLAVLNIFKYVLGKFLMLLFIFLDEELMLAPKESHK